VPTKRIHRRRFAVIAKILVRAPIVLKDVLKDKARRDGVSLNAIVLQALWEYVEKRAAKGKEEM
jgi:predicted HicB family RNase H-like nuclease